MTTIDLVLTSAFAAVSAQATDDGSQTFGDFLQSGGELMIAIGLCSVFVVALTVERLLALRLTRVCPQGIDEPLEAIAQGRFEDAGRALGEDRSPAGRILGAGLRRRGYELRDVEGAMSDQAQKEVERLRHNVRPLVLIGGIAPLLGLLGTVLGIAESFRRVSQTGMGKPEILAGGIEMALTTTIAGLCVAIPALVLASWLQGRVRRRVLHLDERLSPAVEHLARRPVVEESHAA
jgi:biopolymer transport protein ExbB